MCTWFISACKLASFVLWISQLHPKAELQGWSRVLFGLRLRFLEMATIYHKNGKTIKMSGNGVTTITKTVDGKQVTKTYNTNPNESTSINISKNVVNVEQGQGKGNTATPIYPNRAGNIPTSAPRSTAPRSAGRSPGQKTVKNMINIHGSTIGNMSVNNKGPTIFSETSQKFEAGAKNTEVKISGGNFSQANIAGESTYNNRDSNVGGGGGGKGPGKLPGKIGTLEDFIASSTGAEQKVLAILRTGISSQHLCAILRRGLTIDKIAKALEESPNARDAMIQSMLQYDGDEDSDEE